MSNDYFRFRRFTIRQEACAMKVGTDGVLLGAWSSPCNGKAPATVLDIGTGTGIVALMTAQRYPDARITAIDIDRDAAVQAAANAAASPFAERIRVEERDLQQMPSTGRFDLITCNPPYFYNSLVSPDGKRTLARHAATLTLAMLATHAARLLAPGGTLAVVLPAAERSRMESEASFAGLFTARICTVSTTARKPPSRMLMAFTNTPPASLTEEHLVVGDEACRRLTSAFYL